MESTSLRIRERRSRYSKMERNLFEEKTYKIIEDGGGLFDSKWIPDDIVIIADRRLF